MLIIVLGVVLVVIVLSISTKGDYATYVGKVGESRTKQYLKRLPADEYIVLNDLTITDSKGITTQIDHLIVSQYGIFVIETKCYSGWIFGDEKGRVWTQTLPCGRGWWSHAEKYTFQNPLRQNWRHIYVLSEQLKLSKENFFNVVVFAGDAEFKTELPYNVMHEMDLISYIKSFDKKILSAPYRDKMVADIQRLDAAVTDQQKAAHVYKLQVVHSLPPTVSNKDAPPRCPQCGAMMRVRHRHADNAPFYGCSRYPECKGIVNLQDE